MIAAGGSYSIAGAALEGALLAVIKDWANENPADVETFRQQMRRERDGLYQQGGHGHARGMSKEATQLVKGRIPTKLFHMIERRVERDWLRKPEVRIKFWRIFKIGLLNETSEMNR